MAYSATVGQQDGRGFSLIEGLIVLSILGILAALAVPSWSEQTERIKIQLLAQRFSADISLSRLDALLREQFITLCAAQPGHGACQRAGHWNHGWLSFEDDNHDRQWQAGERILRAEELTSATLDIRGRAFRASDYISFYSNGLTQLNGTYIFCSKIHRGIGQAVILSRSGRTRIVDAADTDPPACRD